MLNTNYDSSKQPPSTLLQNKLNPTSLASVKERSFKNHTLFHLGELLLVGATVSASCVSLGCGLPVTITVGIIAMAILSIHRHARQKALVKEIAHLEEISTACRQALLEFPDPIARATDAQIYQIVATMDKLCEKRNKDDKAQDDLFYFICKKAEDIHPLIPNIRTQNPDPSSREHLLRHLERLNQIITKLQKESWRMASSY